MSIQKGYLQYLPTGSDQAQKVFVTVSNQEIIVYPEDPSKFDQPPLPLARLDSQKIQLVESGDFQRPKSFGVISDRGNLIEFSCPTNSVRTSWVNSIREIARDASSFVPLKSKAPNMDIYRTPISTVRIPTASNRAHNATNAGGHNRFSDFDGFANQALHHLNALKSEPPQTNAGPAINKGSSTLNPNIPSIRVVQPTVSKVFGGPALSSSHPPPHNGAVLVQPAVRKATPKAQSAPKPKPQHSSQPKPLPQWVPGHFKTTTLVSHPKNASPQRARRDHPYVQQPPQHGASLLNPSHGSTNIVDAPLPQNHSLHQAGIGGVPTLANQQSSHPHGTYPVNGSLPMEKMTLEQLREAFQSMPMELRSAIAANPADPQHRRPLQPEDSEFPHYNPDTRYNSYRRREKEYYREDRRSRSHQQRVDYSPEEDYRGYRSDEERRPRSRRMIGNMRDDRRRHTRREDSYDRYEDYDRRAPHPQQTDRYSQLEDSDSPISCQRRTDEEEGDFVGREESNFDIPDRSNSKHSRNIAARLDYTDFSEPEEEEGHQHPQELQFSAYQHRKEPVENLPRYMRSKSREPREASSEQRHLSQSRNASSRAASNPRAAKKQPLERSKSAPPPTSTLSGRDLSTKTRSVVPRGDLLEWSKKQAWQKHIASGFPLSKAQEKAKESYKSPSQVKSYEIPVTSKPKEKAPSEPSANRAQRIRATEDRMRRSSVMSANAATKASTGSFFDFMKSRGAPAPQISSQRRDAIEQEGQSRRQPEEMQQTKSMNYHPSEQFTASLQKTKQQYPSSTKHSKLSPGLQRKLAAASSSLPDKKVDHSRGLLKTGRPHPPPERLSKDVGDEVSIISGSTLSIVKLERSLSHQNMMQSNSTTPLTDVAEWQRVTTWLTSFRMEKYIPTFREHSITKLSLIELLAEDDFWELGIEASDIPIIKQRVAEFSQRIKSFAGEAIFEAVPSSSIARQSTKRNGVPPSSSQEEEDPVNRGVTDEATRRRVFGKVTGKKSGVRSLPPKEIHDVENFQVSLMIDFDNGQYHSFFSLWERFVYYFTPHSETHSGTDIAGSSSSSSQRPALYFAKQAMEFHLYVYFYVFAVRKGLGKDEILTAKQGLKEYLENLADQYETFHPLLDEKYHGLAHLAPPNSAMTTTTNTETNQAVIIDDSIVLPSPAIPPESEGEHFSYQNTSAPTPPKPLITSREFATFAGLVFVPNPQCNPAFQTLFTEEWSLALRQRLTQFVTIIVEEKRKVETQLLSPPDRDYPPSPPAEELSQEKERGKRSLSLSRPVETILAEELKKEVNDEAQRVEKLALSTAEISPIKTTDQMEARDDNRPKITVDISASHVHGGVAAQAIRSSTHQMASFDRPAESPQSNGSTISQLTDDTPVKSEHLRRQQQQQQSRPPQGSVPAFTFSKISNTALAEAANRAGVKLKSLQGSSVPTTGPSTTTGKPRINPSPPKSSLQMQVDQYNKLLKQNRLTKSTVIPSSSSPALANNPPISSANPPVTSDLHPQVIRAASTELQQQSNQLMNEMNDPLNQDLIHQIDAIIAPLNQTIVVPPYSLNKDNAMADTHQRPNTGRVVATAPKGFNLGLSLPRGASAIATHSLPPALSDPDSLNNQVNKYKNLLKGKSSSSFEAQKETEGVKEDPKDQLLSEKEEEDEHPVEKDDNRRSSLHGDLPSSLKVQSPSRKHSEDHTDDQQHPFHDISSDHERESLLVVGDKARVETIETEKNREEEHSQPPPSGMPVETAVVESVKPKVNEEGTPLESVIEVEVSKGDILEELANVNGDEEDQREGSEDEAIDEVQVTNTSNPGNKSTSKKKKKKKKHSKKEA